MSDKVFGIVIGYIGCAVIVGGTVDESDVERGILIMIFWPIAFVLWLVKTAWHEIRDYVKYFKNTMEKEKKLHRQTVLHEMEDVLRMHHFKHEEALNVVTRLLKTVLSEEPESIRPLLRIAIMEFLLAESEGK